MPSIVVRFYMYFHFVLCTLSEEIDADCSRNGSEGGHCYRTCEAFAVGAHGILHELKILGSEIAVILLLQLLQVMVHV